MREYKSKEELIEEIQKTSKLFISEFDNISEDEKNQEVEGVERTPSQMIAYQLGWMTLLMSWDRDETSGKPVITPSKGYKWNQLGGLYADFYKQYGALSLAELKQMYVDLVSRLIEWLNSFSDDELFGQDIRKWASSTPSKWPIWKWVHINTVAPFKSFRSKVRKWKKLRLN